MIFELNNCKDSLIDFFISESDISFSKFIELQEEKIDEMGREDYYRLKAKVDARSVLNQDTTDMMKVKFIFFDWLIFSEESEVVVNGNAQQEIPDSWSDDGCRDYSICYKGKKFDVSFGKLSVGTGIAIYDPVETKGIVQRAILEPPTFVTQNVAEERTDRGRCTGIMACFTTHFRCFLLRAALGRNIKKSLHGSDSSGRSLPGYPND